MTALHSTRPLLKLRKPVRSTDAIDANERMLTTAPFDCVSSGKKARVTLINPKQLTARCCRIMLGLLRSSWREIPALLMSTSSVSTLSAARWISESLVTSNVIGVTRSSGPCSEPRVPA